MTSRANRLLMILVTALLAACASDGVEPRVVSLERQIDELRQRLDSLEESRSVELPATQVVCTDPADMNAQIKALRMKRDALSLRYTDSYPDVTDIDKQIRRLEQHLKASKESSARCDSKRTVVNPD